MSDAIECRIGYYVNLPRIAYRVVYEGNVIGRAWSDGHIEIYDPNDMHRWADDGGACA